MDSSKWTVFLPNGGSSVTQADGVVTTSGRGVLGSLSSFASPYEVSGSFAMQSGSEHFNIVIRSDLSGAAVGERTGLLVSFSNDGDQISIQRSTAASDGAILAVDSFSLTTGQMYSFRIRDDGSLVSLSIDNVERLSATSSFQTGGRVGFYSREFSETSTRIDSVTVSAVPEPETYGLVFGAICVLGRLLYPRRAVI